MTTELPMACTLGTGDLEQRLAEIAALGAERLISHEADGDRQLLRFHSDADTRRRLERIVAAEGECCAFLDLNLSDDHGELLFSIAAPPGGAAFAAGLAETFGAAEKQG